MVAKIPVGSQPLAAQPGFGSMWVSNGFDGTVTRIDPRDNTVLRTIKVGPGPYQIAPAGGGVWVATQDAAVKIDPATNQVVARAAYPHPPHTQTPTTAGVALDANAHGVWVSTAYGTVLRLRPSDGRLLKVINVQPVRNSRPGMVAIDGDNVWVSSYTIESTLGPGAADEKYGPVNHLTDISAKTGEIVQRVPTAGYPVDSFLPQHRKLFIVGNDYQHHTSALIRSDWPYQLLTSIRLLDGSSFDVVDTHGFLWIPSFISSAVQIIPDSDGLPNVPNHNG
jgi:YVTN family beta-propeller protein